VGWARSEGTEGGAGTCFLVGPMRPLSGLRSKHDAPCSRPVTERWTLVLVRV
jgi:hypothetical protein